MSWHQRKWWNCTVIQSVATTCIMTVPCEPAGHCQVIYKFWNVRFSIVWTWMMAISSACCDFSTLQRKQSKTVEGFTKISSLLLQLRTEIWIRLGERHSVFWIEQVDCTFFFPTQNFFCLIIYYRSLKFWLSFQIHLYN